MYQILDHVADLLKRMGRDEQLVRVYDVRTKFEHVGQVVGSRLLEQPLHRRALIGVAFDFGF